MSLLRIPDVQKELKMTPEQITKAQTKQQELGQANQALMQEVGGPQGLRNLSQEDRQKLMDKMQAAEKKALAEVLEPDQLKRVNQLELQRAGSRALTRKDVAESLKLTKEQTEKITTIQQEAAQARRDAMQGVDFQNMTAEERQQMQQKMAEAQKATDEKIFATLMPDQNKKWKELTGAPFKFPPFNPGQGRQRPGQDA